MKLLLIKATTTEKSEKKDDSKDVNIIKLLFRGCLEYQWPVHINLNKYFCIKLCCKHY